MKKFQKKISAIIVGFGGFMLGGGMMNSDHPTAGKFLLGGIIAFGAIYLAIMMYPGDE
jgi:hypothetical protein